jgi:precorrin-2/cobalt-factor-2 C20-methyltransferase
MAVPFVAPRPASAGTLFGIGAGPGDPELLTLKAVRLVREATHLAYFAKRGARGNAFATISPHLRDGQNVLRFEYPITTEAPPAGCTYAEMLHDFYDASGRAVGELLDAGDDVAVICEGDPLFFGSFMYLHDRLAHRYSTEIVAGVSSVVAASAAVGVPLTRRDDEFRVLAGIATEDELVAGLAGAGAAVVMKLGRNLPKVRRAVERAGLMDRAWYVERATMPGQRVVPLAELGACDAPYFSLVMIPSRLDR